MSVKRQLQIWNVSQILPSSFELKNSCVSHKPINMWKFVLYVIHLPSPPYHKKLGWITLTENTNVGHSGSWHLRLGYLSGSLETANSPWSYRKFSKKQTWNRNSWTCNKCICHYSSRGARRFSFSFHAHHGQFTNSARTDSELYANDPKTCKLQPKFIWELATLPDSAESSLEFLKIIFPCSLWTNLKNLSRLRKLYPYYG